MRPLDRNRYFSKIHTQRRVGKAIRAIEKTFKIPPSSIDTELHRLEILMQCHLILKESTPAQKWGWTQSTGYSVADIESLIRQSAKRVKEADPRRHEARSAYLGEIKKANDYRDLQKHGLQKHFDRYCVIPEERHEK